MDDGALSLLVDTVMGEIGGSPGTFHKDGGKSTQDEQDEVGKQVLMASLRRGYFTNDPIAVGIGGKIDADYGNPGPEIDPIQQMTNSGYLSAVAESSENDKQARYRMMCMFGSNLVGPMGDELRALRDDDDVHSVSVISGGQDSNPEHFHPCAIDCWLKRRYSEPAGHREPLPDFGARQQPSSDQSGECSTPYTPLAAKHTRILGLEAGNFGDEITCSLIAQPVAASSVQDQAADLIVYEALSYTWGDPTPKFSVQCNGKTLPVAYNLYSALQHLRDTDTRRYLWIDAICINQNDTDERSMQIQYMLDIYQEAARVVIWLGEESVTSTLAVESMKALDQPLERKGIMFRVHEPGCYEQLKDICIAQGELLERPWFVRSWIRQELSVAKDVIVLCGRDSLTWYVLKRSAARLGHFRHKLSKETVMEVSGSDKTRHGLAISYLTRGWKYGQSVSKVLGNIRSIWYYHAGGLFELLLSGRQFEATDPRDKVYAVLGLGQVSMTQKQSKAAEETAEDSSYITQFPVDYSKSVSEVYQDTVKYFINRDANLDILSLLLTCRNAHSDTDLPSWVPDWRVPASEIPITQHWDFLSLKFAASGLRSKAEHQRHDETGILRAKGFFFDQIKTQTPYTANVYDMLSLVPEFNGHDSAPQDDDEGQTGLYVRDFDASKDKTWCVETSHGMPCLAPATALVGDHIAVLFGGKHMFVVRLREVIRAEVGNDSRSKAADGKAGGGLADGVEGQSRGVEAARSSVDPPGDEGENSDKFVCELIGPCIHPSAMFGKAAKIFRERQGVVRDFVFI